MKIDDVTVKEVSFRRKFNLGNYETLDIELTAAINDGQNVQEVLSALEKGTIKYMKFRED